MYISYHAPKWYLDLRGDQSGDRRRMKVEASDTVAGVSPSRGTTDDTRKHRRSPPPIHDARAGTCIPNTPGTVSPKHESGDSESPGGSLWGGGFLISTEKSTFVGFAVREIELEAETQSPVRPACCCQPRAPPIKNTIQSCIILRFQNPSSGSTFELLSPDKPIRIGKYLAMGMT